jgi:hypothetical protein
MDCFPHSLSRPGLVVEKNLEHPTSHSQCVFTYCLEASGWVDIWFGVSGQPCDRVEREPCGSALCALCGPLLSVSREDLVTHIVLNVSKLVMTLVREWFQQQTFRTAKHC